MWMENSLHENCLTTLLPIHGACGAISATNSFKSNRYKTVWKMTGARWIGDCSAGANLQLNLIPCKNWMKITRLSLTSGCGNVPSEHPGPWESAESLSTNMDAAMRENQSWESPTASFPGASEVPPAILAAKLRSASRVMPCNSWIVNQMHYKDL